MLSPKKLKYRKKQKGRMTGTALSKGSRLEFGEYGLQALECGFMSAQQIEAARIAITRHVKRGGKIWIRVFPDKPVTKKPAETRIRSGAKVWIAGNPKVLQTFLKASLPSPGANGIFRILPQPVSSM